MPVIYNTPGVYIEEVATLPASVVQVPSAVPAFIGVTARQPKDSCAFLKIGSLFEYVQLFGGAMEEGTAKQGYLYSSIKLFYANGGGDAFIHSTGTKVDEQAADDFIAALAALEKETEPTLILFPDAVMLGTADLVRIQAAALMHCQKLGSRFCILDVPSRSCLLTKDIASYLAALGHLGLEYGACYGPWLQLIPPEAMTGEEKQSPDTQTKAAAEPAEVPASGAVAGVFAAIDSTRGVWKAPANVSISGIIGVTEVLNDQDQQSLNGDPDGKFINVIRAFPGKAVLVWGARTLRGNDSEWRYISVRRLFITVEESIRRATGFVVFEPNDASTWIKLKAMIEDYLSDLWRQGALAGSKPEQAFFVNVGLGTSMSAQDILEGRLIINVGMAAVRPAEFIVIRFLHLLQAA